MKTSVFFLVTLGVFLLFDGLQAQSCLPALCPKIKKPVCAFNPLSGKLTGFSNKCSFEAHQCKNPALIYLFEAKCMDFINSWNNTVRKIFGGPKKASEDEDEAAPNGE